MDRTTFDTYIRRFNDEDATAFDDYLAPDMRMLNGALEFSGVDGMRDHYQNKIWPYFTERPNVLRFVGDGAIIAIDMWTRFTARNAADTIFGAAVPGEIFDYRGLIMYDVADGKFKTITVSYNSFRNTKTDGRVIEMGMPH